MGNLPPSITVPQLTEFFNSSVKQLGVSKDSLPPVIAVWISPDGHYAFVELRTMDEATAALNCLNGAQIGVYSLKIGRPKGYTAPGNMSVLPTPVQPKLTNLPTVSLAPSTEPLPLNALSNVMMISNLPSMIAPEQIRELFVPFGQVSYPLIFVVSF